MTIRDRIAVLDVGKSNVKLSAVDPDGHVLETLSTPNPVLPGPPWRHHDLKFLNDWVLTGLADLCRAHAIGHFISTGHGSGGVLVHGDPDQDGDGAALSMPDYEEPLDEAIARDYAPQAGGFLDRGSAIMMASFHTGRQIFRAEREQPQAFAKARHFLGIPQYWAWRLSGVAVSEVTILGAQSHLWNVAHARWAPIVIARGWQHLMPPIVPACQDLGPIRPALAQRYGLPLGLRVHAGSHDSSTNFHRFHASGMSDICIVSTGTWIVAMADRIDIARLDEARGMTCNADVSGAPLGGALSMGGREYPAVAGPQPQGAMADMARIAAMIARGTMALPSFGQDDSQFPGSAGRGRIIGPPPDTAEDRLAVAVLYLALLTVECANALAPDRPWILDGSFLRDPAFAPLVAALRGERETYENAEGYGVAAGAAALCNPERRMPPAPMARVMPDRALPGLVDYAAQWRALAGESQNDQG